LFSSATALTIKFGPLPMYVIEPKNTAPVEIAFSKTSGIPATKLPVLFPVLMQANEMLLQLECYQENYLTILCNNKT
jgi:hypothetical protein